MPLLLGDLELAADFVLGRYVAASIRTPCPDYLATLIFKPRQKVAATFSRFESKLAYNPVKLPCFQVYSSGFTG